MSIEEYYTEYSGNTSTAGCGPDGTSIYDISSSDGYQYPYWTYPYYYIDYRWYYPYYESPNKTEQAYRILKQLVGAKVIPEPDSYQKFCDLFEKIKAVL